MLVKLQRPPPEISIFLPARSACSSKRTRRPRLPASIAQKSPAAPAPITTTSHSGIEFLQRSTIVFTFWCCQRRYVDDPWYLDTVLTPKSLRLPQRHSRTRRDYRSP